MTTHKIKLTFFKRSGKFYSEAEFELPCYSGAHLFDIWREVDEMRSRRDPRTGLTSGGVDFFCAVDVPTHSLNHPHLLLPRNEA